MIEEQTKTMGTGQKWGVKCKFKTLKYGGN